VAGQQTRLAQDGRHALGDCIGALCGPAGLLLCRSAFCTLALVAQMPAPAAPGADSSPQDEAREGLHRYSVELADAHERAVAAKLGLASYDRELNLGLMRLMYTDSADFTNTYRCAGGRARLPDCWAARPRAS
jgi:hypothetical protein